jgi:1-aminocyclopropane-1-carboxylate deaminase
MTVVIKPAIISKLPDPVLKSFGVEILVLRDELLHPVLGGNKFRKLKYNLIKAKQENKTTLVTFGGAYSNHIAATAFAGKEHGFKTIGLIRGEKTEPLNITLNRAVDCGMELLFIDRETYRDKKVALNTALKDTDRKNFYIIPEGGGNYEGFKGCCEIADEIKMEFNYICCPCGTGTTLAGIAESLKKNQTALGFSVMKNNFSLEKDINAMLSGYDKKISGSSSVFKILYDYHFGGYAKTNDELNDFVKRFGRTNEIEIEPVYTGKMFYGIYDLVQKGFFKRGDIVVAVHTGGLQYLR